MISGTNIGNIYIVHGIKGYETREPIMEELLKKQHGLDYELVTESWDQEQNDAWLQKYFEPEIKKHLQKGSTYCTLVHFLIYEKVVQNNDKFALIFENDICFIGSNFLENIAKVAREAEQLPEGFIISLENSTLLFPPWRDVKKGKYLYEATKGRCAGAYLIDRAAARIMLDELKTEKCRVVIDWWHNIMVQKGALKMYWAHPPLTEQGSFNGTLSSSISIRNNGTVRRFRWLAQKFVKMYITRWFR